MLQGNKELTIIKKTLQDMKQQYETTPVSNKEYCIDNTKFLVVSHYTGGKDVDEVLTDIAIKKAYADMEKTSA